MLLMVVGWWRMGLQRLVVVRLDRLHVLHVRVLLVVMMVVELWLEVRMLMLRRMMGLLLLLALLLHGILLRTLGLRLRCDGTDSCLGCSLGSLLGSQCSLALFNSAGHIAIGPSTCSCMLAVCCLQQG